MPRGFRHGLHLRLLTVGQAELAAEFPIDLVCERIGNGRAIAEEHDLRTADAEPAKATKTSGGPPQNPPPVSRDGPQPVVRRQRKDPRTSGGRGRS